MNYNNGERKFWPEDQHRWLIRLDFQTRKQSWEETVCVNDDLFRIFNQLDYNLYEFEIIRPVDPNDVIGPACYGDKKWIGNDHALVYNIRFENDPKLATAPAQIVTIRQSLDPSIDPRTFRLGTFGFGSFTFNVPENRSFYTGRLDVRDSLGVYVDVNAGIDITKNEAFLIFKSIDPATGDTPINPLSGFLPVNDEWHHGEGFVSYTVRPEASSQTGDRISALASIIFDINEPPDTPEIFNTIDAGAPISRMDTSYTFLDSTSFEIRWSGRDDANGSGIQSYTIYVTEDSSLFRTLATDITDTSLVFTGDLSKTYRFFSIAKDNVGNSEPMKTKEELIVTLIPEPPEELPREFILYQSYPNPFNPVANIKYALPKPAKTKIAIYNLMGQQVRVLIDSDQPAGYHTIQWDGTNDGGNKVATGQYFYRMKAGDFVKVRKMMLIR